MDSLTHIVLGACAGEAIAGRRLGKRAMFIGAIANSFPDIDVVGSLFLDPSQNLLAHRGLTHSIFFLPFATFLMALLTKLVFLKRASMRKLLWLWSINMAIHLFIDAFNAYGTGWLEPFSDRRIAFHSLFVADPLFTLWPLVATLALLVVKPEANRITWWKVGLYAPVVYLGLTLFIKQQVEEDVKKALFKKQIRSESALTTPAPFNSLLWFVMIRTKDGYYIGYHSVLDQDGNMQLSFVPRNESLLTPVKDKRELNNLLQFADGYYSVQNQNGTTVFNVLRFGQVVGWYDSTAPFVFRYQLDQPGDNTLVTQRGRFERWNDTTVHALWERIKGY